MHKVRARTKYDVENKRGGKGGREDDNSTVDNEAAFIPAASLKTQMKIMSERLEHNQLQN